MINGISTPLDKKPTGRLVLRKTFQFWGAGTTIDFVEYCDTQNGFPTKVLGRIKGELLTIPLEYVVERRVN